MRKAKEFRDQSLEELNAAINDERKELFQLINEMKRSKKIEKPHLIAQKKKDIARMLTVISEKQAVNKQCRV